MDLERTNVSLPMPRLGSRLRLAASVLAISWITGLVVMNTPLVGDVKIFYSAAHQAILANGFSWDALFQGWELKPFAWRAWNLALYQVITQFVDFADKRSFEPVALGLHFTIIFSLCFLTATLARDAIEGFLRRRVDRSWITVILFTAFMTQAFTNLHQTEDIATALCFLLSATLLSKTDTPRTQKLRELAIGGLSTYLLFLKLVTLALVPMAFLLAWSLEPGSWRRRDILVSLSSMTLGFTVLWLLQPQEIQNWIDASLYQQSGQGLTLKNWFISPIGGLLKHAIFGNLFVLLGVFLAPLALWECWEKKDWRWLVSAALLYAFAIAPVTVQKKYFVYHYIPVSVVGTFVFLQVMRSHRWRAYGLGALICGTLILSVFNTQLSSYLPESTTKLYERANGGNFSWPEQKTFHERWLTQTLPKLREVIQDTKVTVLYLDDGASSYYLGNPTASKYFYPLPVARSPYYFNQPDAKIFKTDAYRQLRALIDTYDGPYVVSTKWFSEEHFPEVYAHLESAYEKVTAPPPRTREVFVWRHHSH